MSHRCIDESQLDRLLELADDHPERREVNSCVRCRTLLAQYAAFKTGHVPDEAEYKSAESALDDYKESLLSDSTQVKPSAQRLSRSIWSSFRRPRTRLILGATAVVVLFVTVITWAPWSEREIVLRSESPESEHRIELPDLRFDDTGTVELNWPRVRGADTYRVLIHTTSFEQIFSKSTSDSLLILAIDDLPSDLDANEILQWRIEAFRGGEIIDTSLPGVILGR
jgi:hypothetical protein